MAIARDRNIYFSFFMFTADLRPDDRVYTQEIVRHIRKLREMGYDGFDLPIAPGNTTDHQGEVESYSRFREELDKAGLGDVKFTTNVAATRTFDPSSSYAEQREVAFAYLKSRVDITKALRADIMAGPIVFPYSVFPTTDANQPIWSNALQDWAEPRYRNAQPLIERLGEHADGQSVKVAIEPVDHWETPSPNMVREVMNFLRHVRSPQVGVCIDSAHVVLGSDGPEVVTGEVRKVSKSRRLHYVHISAPDRGAVHDSWIPWKPFLGPILEGYDGPFLVEVFNAIPVFLNGLRLTRRKFSIPGEDASIPGCPDAYEIARLAILEVRRQIAEVAGPEPSSSKKVG
ncbi:Sugar phosphate isomerase/epimerase [Singulisphaera sp. GP187]|uniref:sugar phosphate isomerase/epimerase family protein n=1 Tax=Singulisphaera sp. GP187 TaxID=1882752 RepID=UPI00092BD4E9|nr:sugar phosphate isomerase/epimerase family protein [Singulisphaera sp. GP187]SIO57753.1 Sugar phosphate isomerase/epimerase [Singulisphaera sp. GP187]